MSQARFEEWISERKISEVECLVADMSGTARGKILPPKKFLKGNRSRGLRIPEEVFTLTINGRYVMDTDTVSDAAIDIYMQPDADTMLPLLADRGLVNGLPAAYVCENYACKLPVTTPEALAQLLE